MDHTQKMFLVPQHELDSLRHPGPSQPKTIRKAVESRLDSYMRNILLRVDISDNEKAKLYTNSLQKYLALVKQG